MFYCFAFIPFGLDARLIKRIREPRLVSLQDLDQTSIPSVAVLSLVELVLACRMREPGSLMLVCKELLSARISYSDSTSQKNKSALFSSFQKSPGQHVNSWFAVLSLNMFGPWFSFSLADDISECQFLVIALVYHCFALTLFGLDGCLIKRIREPRPPSLHNLDQTPIPRVALLDLVVLILIVCRCGESSHGCGRKSYYR